MFKKLIFLTFCGLFSLSSAQNDRQKLSAYLDSLALHHKAVGSYAMAVNGKPEYVKVTGFADFDTKQKANVHTQYRIGSVSKIYTAVLVMKAVEEKKITLDAKLSQYFPLIKNAENISIKQLLQHRTGIHNLTDEEEYFNYHLKPHTEAEMLAIINKYPSDFTPGEKFQYSNSNFILLGYILEKIYKESYAELIQQKIAKPLKLKLTRVGDKIDVSKNQAYSYIHNGIEFEKIPETHMSVPIGAGNLISTPTEMLQFIIALEGGKLISKTSLDQMKQFQDGYGLGLSPVPFYTMQGYGHTGRIEEFRSVLFYFPKEEVGISFITNQSSYDVNTISINMLSTATGKDFVMPSFEEVKVDPSILKKYEGTYKAPNFPLDIKIFVQNGRLMGQATGQGPLAFEVVSETEFKFDAAGIKIKFNPNQNTFDFKQGAAQFVFTKQ